MDTCKELLQTGKDAFHDLTKDLTFTVNSKETLVLVGTTTGLICLYYHQKWRYFRSRGIPHKPASICAIGDWREAMLPEEIFTSDLEEKKKYGKVYGHFKGTLPAIMVHDPDTLKQIMVTQFDKFPVHVKHFKKVSGTELGTAMWNIHGDEWRRIRSTIAPSFNSTHMRAMYTVMEKCAEYGTDEIQTVVKERGGLFCPKEVFARLSLDMVLATALGNEIVKTNNPAKKSELINHAKPFFEVGSLGFKMSLLMTIPLIEKLLEWTGWNFFNHAVIKYFKGAGLSLVSKKLQTPEDQRPSDILQLMIDSLVPGNKAPSNYAKGLTQREILGNALFIVIASSENTSNAIVYLCYNLAQYQVVQEKLREEVDKVCGKQETLDYECIGKLKYMDQCINESLRLYSNFARNTRYCTQDVTINGVRFEKGLRVDIPTFALSHDPEHWDEPFQFKPERMADMKSFHPMLFQAFGAGPRACIGARFAMFEIKVTMAKLLQKFTIQPAATTPEPPLKQKFTASIPYFARPATNFDLRLVERN